MARMLSLDEIVFSDEVAAAWNTLLDRLDLAVAQLRLMGRQIEDGDIKVMAVIEKDGSLTLHIAVSNLITAEFPVPPEHWARKQ